MRNNCYLTQAAVNKNDEFYTPYNIIDKEIRLYDPALFYNKIIYCNCDDYRWSNFYKYFHTNFHTLGLKKLITTNYVSYQYDLFDSHLEKDTPKKCVYDGVNEQVSELKGDGCFSSQECIDLLQESDIIITNPPFSLFRCFIDLLIWSNKKFLILGNVNAVSYKNILPLFVNNQVWLGGSIHGGGIEFLVPNNSDIGSGETGKSHKTVKLSFVRWFTNLGHSSFRKLNLTTEYDPSNYVMLDNLNVLNIDYSKDIPKDYTGFMGVPVTFIDYYHRDCGYKLYGEVKDYQFRLLEFLRVDKSIPTCKPTISGRECFTRLVIKKMVN